MQFLLRISSISMAVGDTMGHAATGNYKASLRFNHRHWWLEFLKFWTCVDYFWSLGVSCRKFSLSLPHVISKLCFCVFFSLCLELSLKREETKRVRGESVGEAEKRRESEWEKEKGSLWCTPMEFIIRITSVIFTFSLRVFFPYLEVVWFFKKWTLLCLWGIWAFCALPCSRAARRPQHTNQNIFLPFLSLSQGCRI